METLDINIVPCKQNNYFLHHDKISIKGIYFKLHLNFQIRLIREEIQLQKAFYGKIQHLYGLNQTQVSNNGVQSTQSRHFVLKVAVTCMSLYI